MFRSVRHRLLFRLASALLLALALSPCAAAADDAPRIDTPACHALFLAAVRQRATNDAEQPPFMSEYFWVAEAIYDDALHRDCLAVAREDAKSREREVIPRARACNLVRALAERELETFRCME